MFKKNWPLFAMAGVMFVVIVGAAIIIVNGLGQKQTDDTASTYMSNGQTPPSQTPTQTYGGGNCGSSCPQTQSQGSGKAPVEGTLVAISATSVTVKPTGGGANKTLTITSDTTEILTSGEKTFNPKDFTIGKAITVLPIRTDASVAEKLVLDTTGMQHSVQE